MRSLILYVTYSGNTEEIAEIIEKTAKKKGFEVACYDLFQQTKSFDFATYDVIFLGSFTWDYGEIPDELEDFLHGIELDHEQVAVFGSGDTQFGGDALYCKAVERLVRIFSSKWSGLKIEQSPRGSQEEQVVDWAERVLDDVKTIDESQNVRTTLSE